MLSRLAVRDLALIEFAELELGAGLNVLTGETGAGKSLLVTALDLVLGGRADTDLIRRGAPHTLIEATFESEGLPVAASALLDEAGIDTDGELILRRVVGADGRSRAFVNERALTLRALRKLGPVLADLHGQHAHQQLLDESCHAELLDTTGDLATLSARVATTREQVKTSRRALEACERDGREAAARARELEELVATIDRLAPEPDELERLRRVRERARHLDGMEAALRAAETLLVEEEGAALERLGVVEKLFSSLRAIDPFFAAGETRLGDLRDQLLDLARDAEKLRSGLDRDGGAVEEIETRLARLERLSRRHGSLAGAIEAAAQAREELAALGARVSPIELARRVAAEEERLLDDARTLGTARRRAARRLERRVNSELETLGFPGAALSVSLVARPESEDVLEQVGERGGEEVRFRIAPNPGEGERPLASCASGGELARVMLAMRSALAGGGGSEVLVFDEVDQAIGGAVLDAVADRLRALSRDRQVICVTHEARVAARADRHLVVAKSTGGERTQTVVRELATGEREEELVRMLGGRRAGSAARSHARELLAELAPLG